MPNQNDVTERGPIYGGDTMSLTINTHSKSRPCMILSRQIDPVALQHLQDLAWKGN